MRPPGQGWWDRLSPRTRWRLQHYGAAVIILPSLALSLAFQAWPSVATNVIIVTFCLLGDAASRQAYVQGHHDGVMSSLDAMRQAEGAEEFGRLASVHRAPWQDRQRPPVAP